MKKFFSFIFVVLLVASFSACNNTDTTEANDTTNQTTVTTTVDDTTVSTEAPTSTLVSIEVGTMPSKVVYDDQESFDSTGLVILANYTWSNSTTSQEDVTSQ